MIHLDTLWDKTRYVEINGRNRRIPFAVNLNPDFVKFIHDWLKTNGPEWTVGRLKILVLWALQILSGNQDYSSPWFSKTRYQGYLIPNLRLFKYLVRHRQNPKKICLVLTVLKSYRLRTWGKRSLETVGSKPKSVFSDQYARLLMSYCDLPRIPKDVLETTEAINTSKHYATDTGKTYPGPYGLKDFEYPAEIRFLYEDENKDPRILGTLTTVEDKGKYRTILVGHWAIQLKTKRLADFLRQWLWKQDEVASGDQNKMKTFILSSLEKKKFMMSIDLTAATDLLSREFQIQILTRLGVPRSYFNFLNLPAAYRKEEFTPEKGKGIDFIKYSNGQPMGLFLSFPMFELMHFVILKYVVAKHQATFCICGDDCVIATDESSSNEIFERYKSLIELFGGEISLQKTIFSKNLAEGIGAIFLKGHSKEIRIPSGKLSSLEAMSPGFWLYHQIKKETPLGRAFAYSLLSHKEMKEYSYSNRRALNESMLLTDLSDMHIDSLRSLAKHKSYPMSWYVWEPDPEGISFDLPRYQDGEKLPDEFPSVPKKTLVKHLRYVSLEKYRDARVTSKIITLYKGAIINESK